MNEHDEAHNMEVGALILKKRTPGERRAFVEGALCAAKLLLREDLPVAEIRKRATNMEAMMETAMGFEP